MQGNLKVNGYLQSIRTSEQLAKLQQITAGLHFFPTLKVSFPRIQLSPGAFDIGYGKDIYFSGARRL